MKEIKNLYKHFLKSDGVSTDTREELTNKIFFSLSGENFDGNKFAKTALANGASLAVVDNEDYCINNNYFLVDNVLETLQALATHHRINTKATIFGITGSNGKTTTKELIYEVLSNEYSVIATRGNLNNHIGVPLTLLNIKQDTQIAIIEMGANHIGEINQLCEIAIPNLGLITNIGKAHLEGFGSYEGVIIAKNELYNYLKAENGSILLNNDDKLLVELARDLKKSTYGCHKADVEAKIINSFPYLNIEWKNNGIVTRCNSRMYGDYNFFNILAAITAGIYFNIDHNIINSAIEGYVSSNNRSQVVSTSTNKIILDAYNANPFSMEEAIESFAKCKFKNPWILLGDMFELGKYAIEEHQLIINKLNQHNFSNVILLGKEFAKTLNNPFKTFETTKEVTEYLRSNRIENSNILIKGSRGMKMEDIIQVL
ncbi:MAG: UDP-N-acetylmuramoyl-tripeptide--D-alanyl-D-alanine ligase [Lentimicrobiaceae bacterium]|jgi:UDP-N-acetylmuramoyl-tripeptide--D-alanyl-D-alanine ligase|nr:UDP-N-acetylmuramoyl-tripeptide--D-alanyl-D-alanine ligase [Lentimicrobiaceae bacterium]MCP4910893.1 UDP-N-acetylmuramoyl-tripeptide--D-alanyl-D-alanine ligase [Bacteroidota bacterium]MBT3453737.1 UDP-N-acetylmuramoyl-tripeptide--D-alanyl-D-alanine ligase [Lentimicrobiaceae bacterium]MBT3819538.1 UDP-N-acetylmuramoyl-tripeptide--D-alanyl-D-alanine ligase [Lentimicrobiaceae bacterium]MBT4061679.1 UDP-N-acetylmuramoyl-tripeptide--D-alanyl-D-alanine ligase [Lentimicrobiaceae bacterium]